MLFVVRVSKAPLVASGCVLCFRVCVLKNMLFLFFCRMKEKSVRSFTIVRFDSTDVHSLKKIWLETDGNGTVGMDF